jgi:hypothetical protein
VLRRAALTPSADSGHDAVSGSENTSIGSTFGDSNGFGAGAGDGVVSDFGKDSQS